MRPANHPLFFIALAYACGILTAPLVHCPLTPALIFAAIITCSTVIFAVCLRDQSSSEPRLLRSYTIVTIAILLCFYSLGLVGKIQADTGVKDNRVRSLLDSNRIVSGEPLEVTGALMRQGEPSPDGMYFTVSAESIRAKDQDYAVSGVVRLFVPLTSEGLSDYLSLELNRGARIRVMTRLSREDTYRNPGSGSFVEYLDREGYDAIGLIKSSLLIERLDNEKVFLPSYFFDRLREKWLAQIDGLFSREASGVLKASLLGNRFYLSRSTAERFREGGTFHLLVISGLHISFLGGLIYALMGVITHHRRPRFVISVLVVWAYTLMVGAETSVTRATLMFTMASLASVLFRRNSSLNTLGCTLLVLLVWRPDDLFDPSFQLTFLSVFAILALAWPLLENMKAIGAWRPTRAQPYPPLAVPRMLSFCQILFWSEQNWKRELKSASYSYKIFKHPRAAQLERWRVQLVLRYAFVAVTVSLSVQTFLLPLLIVYFHRLSIISILLNVWVGAVMAVLSLLSVVALFTALISQQLSTPLIWLVEHANWILTHSVDPFVKWQMASMRVPEYTGAAAALYFIYYVPLVVLIVMLARWKPLRAPEDTSNKERRTKFLSEISVATSFALAIILVTHPFSASLSPNRLEINFLDVGQGDAALIVMPDGKTVLVDGGGRMEHKRSVTEDEEQVEEAFISDRRSIGEAVVAEYLWRRGLDHVDYLLATHGDADHIQGLSDIARWFQVRQAFIARMPQHNQEYLRFAATLAERNIQATIVGAGDKLSFGAVEIKVLWPPHQDELNADWGNNESIVLRLVYGRKSFLLTGDIEKKAEAQILTEVTTDELQSDVLKVAHHGSKTSSTQLFVDAVRPQLAVVSVGRTSPFGHPSHEVMERWREAGAEILTTGENGTITLSTDGSDLKVKTFVEH